MPAKTAPATPILSAWAVDDGIWHIQSRELWLSNVLRDAGLKRVARAINGGHLTIWETDNITPLRPLLRRHKGRILR